MDPHSSKQHEGLQHAVTKPDARFKPTYFAKEVWGGWGINQMKTDLGQLLHLYSPSPRGQPGNAAIQKALKISCAP